MKIYFFQDDSLLTKKQDLQNLTFTERSVDNRELHSLSWFQNID